MTEKRRQFGFSLMEVLVAVGVLAIGMLFVAGTFPIGIFLTAAATEQTIAPIVADEAYAKIMLYCSDPNGEKLQFNKLSTLWQVSFVTDSNIIFPASRIVNSSETLYPSDPNDPSERVYSWAALLRKTVNQLDPNQGIVLPIEVTVFVCRKGGTTATYPDPHDPTNAALSVGWPAPTKVEILNPVNRRIITVGTAGKEKFINAGCTIVGDENGQVYRVLSRDTMDITLDRDWVVTQGNNSIWVIPPARTGSRSPCISVYQRIVKIWEKS